MKQILALTRYSRLGASSRLRGYQFQAPLKEHGIDLRIEPLFDDSYIKALYGGGRPIGSTLGAFRRRISAMRSVRGGNAILIEKEALPWLPALFELRLTPKHLPLILDFDDALFHRYDMHRSALARRLLGSKIDRLMAGADLIVAGNDYLAERAQRAGARRVTIVPTVVDLKRYIPAPERKSEPPTIGWIGTPNTALYLNMVKPLIAELAKAGRAKAVAIGARPDQMADSAFTAIPWREESEIGELNAIDIGIMPLVDTPWERGKCAYKLIQYMALGIPVVASPVGANRQVVVHGENGLLAGDGSAWRDALESLIADSALRASMGQAGRRTIEAGFSLEAWAPAMAKAFLEVIR